MKIAVVTDSTSYLTPQEVADNDIHVVPIPVIIDGKVYQEGVDIKTADFYANMKSFKSFPSTSQPPVGKWWHSITAWVNKVMMRSSVFILLARFPVFIIA
ncbi:hypothetical protein AGMB00912_01546 [Lactiplantibacillus argentoratensis]